MKNKEYSLKSLVGMALQYQNRERDEHRYWTLVVKLHIWGTPEVVLLAQKLYCSHNWHKRLLSVNIFNQLLVKSKKNRYTYIHYALEDSHSLLCEALSDERPEVISSAIFGLGHRPMHDALSRLVAFANCDNKQIRYALASTLGEYDDEVSIETLLKLASDEDDDVRNWATFSLGSMHVEADNLAIREVLWHNVFDKNEDVSGEALVGLAERKDSRVVDLLKARLTPDCSSYDLRAAEYMSDPSLYPHLEGIKQIVYNDDDYVCTDSFFG